MRMPGRFRSHLTIAYGSAVETTELLDLASTERLLAAELREEARRLAGETCRLLLGLLRRYGSG